MLGCNKKILTKYYRDF